MYCIQCGFTLENQICPSCHNSAIALHEAHVNDVYCWNCGNGLDDDEECCGNCGYLREDIKKHLQYTNCPECHTNIDPAYECPYCTYEVSTTGISYIQGGWKFINKNECPYDLSCGEFEHDKKNNLNYKRDKNGNYSVATRPQVFVHFTRRNGITNKSDIAERLLDITGFKRLNNQRIDRLRQTMPPKITLTLDNKGKLKFSEKELEKWFLIAKKK